MVLVIECDVGKENGYGLMVFVGWLLVLLDVVLLEY